MTPVVFGPADRRLVGFYHPPEKVVSRQTAVLMCCPLGHEATRIHRLYRVIAERLARQGIAVLRFDYFGAGDSPGDDAEGEMTGWCSDLLAAHAELVKRSSPQAIGWIASRLGATLAVQAAPQVAHLNRLVLWDPIVDGAAYVLELRVDHASALDLSFYARDKSWYVAHPEKATTPLTEAIGFGIGRTLFDQMAQLKAESLSLPAGAHTLVFANPADARVARWCHAQELDQRPVRLEPLVHPIVWTSDPLANSAIVPSEVTQRFSALFHEAS
jgi:uncharacterized protein